MDIHRTFALLAAASLGTALPAVAQTAPVVLRSPNGALEMSLATVTARGGQVSASGGQLAYRVSFKGKLLLDWSNLGLALEGAPALGTAVRIESAQPSSYDESWSSVQGKANPIRDHYNAAAVQTIGAGADGRRLTVEARVYDDGVAFRYFVPEQPGLTELRITNEATQFRFTRDATTWALISRGFSTSNEDDYHELTLQGLHPEYLLNLPLLVQSPGIAWVGLTEANLDDWANLYLTAAAGQNALSARLAMRIETAESDVATAPTFDRQAAATMLSVVRQTPARSPWRVLMIADDPGRLVESNMVVNLNPPCAVADPSWIRPGKTAWDWWSGKQAKGVAKPGMNNETMKYYIDFSARNHFEYMLIDAGWASRGPAGTDLTKSIPGIDIPMLAGYARARNVRVWLWAHFRDTNRQIDEAFPQFEKWGIAGVKVDFMDRSDQWMVNWYRMVAKKAAEHHLMVDFHGAFKPDGLQRTYPNVLTREGVMGAEYNKWSARETPKHNVTLAFTRMLAGPMDYTPGGFNNVTREEFVARNAAPMVMGTRAHQTALFVVFESELQMVADSPGAYDGQKELKFLQAVPASWDETRVLNGLPPKYITVARRRGNDWYVGSITDDARGLNLPLSFLGIGSYDAEIYADGPNATSQPKDSTFEKRRVDAKTILHLNLASGGGAAIHLTPVR